MKLLTDLMSVGVGNDPTLRNFLLPGCIILCCISNPIFTNLVLKKWYFSNLIVKLAFLKASKFCLNRARPCPTFSACMTISSKYAMATLYNKFPKTVCIGDAFLLPILDYSITLNSFRASRLSASSNREKSARLFCRPNTSACKRLLPRSRTNGYATRSA